MELNKKSLCLIAYLTTIVSCADILTTSFKVFSLINYVLLFCLTLFLVDLRKVPRDFFLLTLITLFFVSIAAIFNEYEFSIYLKYLLITYIFFISSCERKIIPKKVLNYLIFYPYLTITIVGILQFLLINISPNSPLMYGDLIEQGRAIGLSVETSFYSQQLLIFAVLIQYLDLKKIKNPIINNFLNFTLIIFLLESRSRTTMIGGLLYLLFNFHKANKKAVFTYSSIMTFLAIFVERINNKLVSFSQKLLNLISISGEPREKAFFYMYEKIMNSPIFGYGLNSNIHETGLALGALYANFPIAFIYGIGVGSIPFLYLFGKLIFSSLKTCRKLPILLICIFSFPMPFLYTSFGLLCLFVSTYKIEHLKQMNNESIIH